MTPYQMKRAEEAGVTLLDSPTVNELLAEQERLAGRFPAEDPPTASGDEIIVCDRDEGYLTCITDVLGLCARFPGRRKWVVGMTDGSGYLLAYIFAEDSVRAATARIRRETAAMGKALRARRRK